MDLFQVLLLLLLLIPSATTDISRDHSKNNNHNTTSTPSINTYVHAFYYLWYGNPETDGKYLHWNHEILPHWNTNTRRRYPHGRRHKAPLEIHSPYYPQRGCYSTSSVHTIKDQMMELQRSHVNVVVLSWWGRKEQAGTTDTQGVSTDDTIQIVIDIVEKIPNMYFSIHMEPYAGRTSQSIEKDITYLTYKYKHYKSWHQIYNKNVFYIYDSYHIRANDWKEMFERLLGAQINNNLYIGLWLNSDGGQLAKNSGMDGMFLLHL
jgi:glycoprotein endo-alpha-1,2-mannosidase